MKKIILEILRLAWKALQVVFWKWLKPILAKIALLAALAVGLVVLLVMIISRL